MDHYIRTYLFVFPYPVDDTQYVCHLWKAKKTDGKKFYGTKFIALLGFLGLVFIFACDHVPGKMTHKLESLERYLSQLGVNKFFRLDTKEVCDFRRPLFYVKLIIYHHWFFGEEKASILAKYCHSGSLIFTLPSHGQEL